MPSVNIDTAVSGDNTIVAAPGAGKKLRVHSFFLTSDDSVKTIWKTGSTAKATCYATKAQYGGVAAPHSRDGWFEGADNEALVLNLGAAVSVGGVVNYSVVGIG